MRLKASFKQYYDCLIHLKTVIRYSYAQWLIEDPKNHDYKVVVSVTPENEPSYSIAHRTGIIGQVFRTKQSILASDLSNHPLYDPFDQTIDWELCFPVFTNGKMNDVINLEGKGRMRLGEKVWEHICRTVKKSTHRTPQALIPNNDTHLALTRRIIISANSKQDGVCDIIDLAQAIAGTGTNTLLVGHYPSLLGNRGPTLLEAHKQGLSASYCFYGVDHHLDLLATGPRTQQFNESSWGDWWSSCVGRYEFVISKDDIQTG